MQKKEPDPWKIVRSQFDPTQNRFYESLFSSGNGAMGARGNFEETYSGDSLKGTYVAGVYYNDKTRVGWWKNGYPEYFSKVLNSIDITGIGVKINGRELDLAKADFTDFYQELDMKQSLLTRCFVYRDGSGNRYVVESRRFFSYANPELAVIRYSVSSLDGDAEVEFVPFINADVHNEDANYGAKFLRLKEKRRCGASCSVSAETINTGFTICAAFSWELEGGQAETLEVSENDGALQGFGIKTGCSHGGYVTLIKYSSVITSRNFGADTGLCAEACRLAEEAAAVGYEKLLEAHVHKWEEIWENGDIVIEGDLAAQQGIRFNMYQMNCTYSGTDSRLNIGPKGFTGEKYGGGTYWDTEAYCIYFYLGTRRHDVARQLLMYRYNQLGKACENSAKLGLKGALYPMVTMNGEECHNEWEITFEEIHRNNAIANAVRYYTEYTGDTGYLEQYGIDVLAEISRFWASRVSYSKAKNAYVILGVTGPNEYENNVNNNWYTNRMTKWCLSYTADCLEQWQRQKPVLYAETVRRLGLSDEEIGKWREIAENLYLPYDSERMVHLQQDGFLDKDLMTADRIAPEELPLCKHWSWDRILRSCFIKQADVLQGLWFLNDEFTLEEKQRDFDFYEPMTVHESSLSASLHAVLAAELGKREKAYDLYLRTARLDLDNVNRDTDDGLHITSMAGTWMSIVYGFGGIRESGGRLRIQPFLPKRWKEYSFRLVYRDTRIQMTVTDDTITVTHLEGNCLKILYDREYELKPASRLIFPYQTASSGQSEVCH